MSDEKIMRVAVLAIAFLIILPTVFSIGIAPAKREFTFQSQPQRYDIKIINNEKRDMDVILSVEGVLRDYVKFDQTRVNLTKEEDQKTVGYTVTLPDTLEPGLNRARIIAEETVPNIRFGESYVAAKLNVVSFIEVNVPYPEKYVVAILNVAATEEKIDVRAAVANKGLEDIDTLSGTLGIFEENKKVASQSLQARQLKQDTSDELLATFKAKDVKPGLYSANAMITYDDKSLRLIKDFQIGKVAVNILDFDKYFSQNKINEFNIDIESAWNKEIKNAYAETFVFRNGKEVASFKGTSFDLKPEEKKRITLYFNTQGLELGEYDATVVLHYTGNTNKKEGKLSVITKEAYETKAAEKGGINTYLIMALIALVAVLIVFIIVVMVFFMKTSKK